MKAALANLIGNKKRAPCALGVFYLVTMRGAIASLTKPTSTKLRVQKFRNHGSLGKHAPIFHSESKSHRVQEKHRVLLTCENNPYTAINLTKNTWTWRI